MALKLQSRAEVALGFLSPAERRKADRALEVLDTRSRSQLAGDPRVRRLTGSAAGLYSFRAEGSLRIVFLWRGNECFVEDIVRRNVLDRLGVKGEPCEGTATTLARF